MEEKVQATLKALKDYRMADWDHLPDLDLYMDQVISYLARGSLKGKDNELTPSMINNYVKEGLLSRANNKRYGREHLAYLQVINHLKQVINVKELKLLLADFAKDRTAEQFHTDAVQFMDEILQEGLNTLENTPSDAAFRFALRSYIYRLIALNLLGAEEKEHKKEKGE